MRILRTLAATAFAMAALIGASSGASAGVPGPGEVSRTYFQQIVEIFCHRDTHGLCEAEWPRTRQKERLEILFIKCFFTTPATGNVWRAYLTFDQRSGDKYLDLVPEANPPSSDGSHKYWVWYQAFLFLVPQLTELNLFIHGDSDIHHSHHRSYCIISGERVILQ